MKVPLQNVLTILKKVYFLARPYGRKKMGLVFLLLLVQGGFQVVGVTSIFPFLAVASDPQRIENSQFGQFFLSFLPEMGTRELLIITGCIAILALLCANAINLLAEYVRTRYTNSFAHWLRIRLLRQIIVQPYSFFLRTNSSQLVKKVVGDVGQYTSGVLLPILDSFARVITMILLITTIFLVHPTITLTATLILGLLYFTLYKSLKNIRQNTSEGLKAANRGMFREITQLFSAIKPVKVHRAEEPMIQRLWSFSEQGSRLKSRIPLFQNSPRYLIEPIAFGGLVLVVVYLALQGRDFSDVLPNLAVMAFAGYRLLPSAQLLYGQLTQISTNAYTLDEVYEEFLEAELDEAQHQDPAAQTGSFTRVPPMKWNQQIVLENISFNYPGTDKTVLENIHLTIPKKSSLAVVGPTGSGKSTLIDIIMGLLYPTTGRILVDETPLDKYNLPAWRAGIGYVPQDIVLLDDTLARNIAFGVNDSNIDLSRLREVCHIAQVLDFIESELPKQFDTIVGERGVRLSGGQKQRIGLARALYHEPSLLVLDEATSALDVDTEKAIVDALNVLHGKYTFIIIAHRLSTVEHCEQVLELGGGSKS